MAELYASVMDHARRFKPVTNTTGAFAFNQAFDATEETGSEQHATPPVKAQVIDAVQRSNQDWSGMVEKQHIEYVLKLAISDSKIKIIGKRYSELHEFHLQLQERRLIDPTKSPPFPDKSIVHGNWWKFQDKDPKSEFVQQRKDALNAYLTKLFDKNPGLGFEPFVMIFFELEELSVEAALAASLRTAPKAVNQYIPKPLPEDLASPQQTAPYGTAASDPPHYAPAPPAAAAAMSGARAAASRSPDYLVDV
mmetsp:Transcript_16958/g.49417  ORF Transcript_16958/g.49417 Transcript_16958/m.49417 type:complete len:251 (-) Transcript_16958:533-1285(-)|eukprot:CAMPEP_0118978578 /NCGR_PEP_ID=MMETSP1173-20130426/24014_1 /TAXON_ID=1034831 /ORGANISM="Rhizochromulina marina cf, Strain CCMP1243" /LENGTH=250 /DNA_ID=CAMNT_0006928779 /DNA_START=104 /DNA_END=856 /DNA_ORIENTATION=-